MIKDTKYKQKESLNLRNIVSKILIPTNQEEKPIYDKFSLISYQILREFMRSEFLKPGQLPRKNSPHNLRSGGSCVRQRIYGNAVAVGGSHPT